MLWDGVRSDCRIGIGPVSTLQGGSDVKIEHYIEIQEDLELGSLDLNHPPSVCLLVSPVY